MVGSGRNGGLGVGGPLDVARVLRRPESPLRYWVPRRVVDAWAGRRDGRVDLLALSGAGVAGRGEGQGPVALRGSLSCSRMWLERNEATYSERDRREFLTVQAAVAELRTQLSVVESALVAAVEELGRARQARAMLPDEPPVELLASRGPAESRDSAAVVMMRRRDEHRRVLAAADALVAECETKVRGLADKVAQFNATLLAAFEMTVTRSQRLREFHTRRAQVYLRAYRRVIIRRYGDPATLTFPDAVIPVPDWTTSPCTWTSTPPGTHPGASLRLAG